MRNADSARALQARIDRAKGILDRIVGEYAGFVEGDLRMLGRKNTTAIVVAELMVDYFTCAETLFLRISQFFENELDAERWHADLLEKMVLRIDGVRDAVLSEETARDLGELMRFRHFRRYCFELEYDWDKLEYLQGVFARGTERLPSDLERFQAFLTRLLEAGGKDS